MRRNVVTLPSICLKKQHAKAIIYNMCETVGGVRICMSQKMRKLANVGTT